MILSRYVNDGVCLLYPTLLYCTVLYFPEAAGSWSEV